MAITYPPEMLPSPDPGEKAEVIVCEGGCCHALRAALALAREAVVESFDHAADLDDTLLAEARLRQIDDALSANPPEPYLLVVLKECADRCQYDGDLWHDQGIYDRRDASWKAAKDARAMIARLNQKGDENDHARMVGN